MEYRSEERLGDIVCDYCEKEKNFQLNRQLTDTNISEIFIHTEKDGGALFIRQPRWHIEEVNGVEKIMVRLTTEYAYIDIKYCPFCGKKLVYVDKTDRYRLSETAKHYDW
jgi:hypothetical protein